MFARTISAYKILKIHFRVGIIILITLSLSCKHRNPEQNKLDKLEKSLKYKSYKTLSENTIPPVVLLYNSASRADDPAISEGVLRLLLGYSWLINEQPEYAIAESKIIDDMSTNDKDIKLLTGSLAAMAMYDKGWNSLAAEEAEKASSLLLKRTEGKQTELKIMTQHLLLGTFCIYKENYHGACFHFMAFYLITKIKWPYQIVDAMADIKDNKTQRGLMKIETLTTNKNLPDTLRKSLTESLASTVKVSSAINSKIFWPRIVSYSLYSNIKNSEVKGILKVNELLDNIIKKLNV